MMGWFGPKLGLAIAYEYEEVDTPAGVCLFCSEPFTDEDSGVRYANGPVAHIECFMRGTIGGVNHQLGRCVCCGGTEPPDPPGMSERDAARAAWKLFRTKGQG